MIKAIPGLKMLARTHVKRGIKTCAGIASTLKPSIATDPDQVFVLMYHRVNSYRHNELSVRTDHFRQQVSWLKHHGFLNMKMGELECRANTGVPRVLFTFDDGYEDNYLEALPVLKEFGYTGIFYLTVDYIGTDELFPWDTCESGRLEHNRIMNWDQVRILIDEGMEIGSHTLTHTLLTTLSHQDAEREILESRTKLEDRLGIEITSFCYPCGEYDQYHVDCCRRAGYNSACTAAPSIYRGDDTLVIPRIAVLRSDTRFVFCQKLTGRMDWFRLVR